MMVRINPYVVDVLTIVNLNTISNTSHHLADNHTLYSMSQEYDKNLEEENLKIANRVAMERNIRVDEAARKLVEHKGRVGIRMRIPTGEFITNAFGDKEPVYKEGDYDIKAYQFRKLAAGDWNLYMTKRAELQNEMSKPLGEADQNKIADLNNRIYEFLAMKYLGINHEDYVKAYWDDIRLMVEACNYLTENANIGDNELYGSAGTPPPKPDNSIKKFEAVETLMDEETLRLNKRTVPEPKTDREQFSEHVKDSSSKKFYDYEG